MTAPEAKSAWETETGLPNDVDGYIANPRFGMVREEYAAAVAATGAETPLMFVIDLVDKDNNYIASQGYSIGSGWIASEDGLSVSHPKRRNVVGSSMYGQLQNRVVKELKVNMDQYGLPTDAKAWNGLGFHWIQEPHATLKPGETRTAPMPVEFLGKRDMAGVVVPGAAAPAAPVPPAAPAPEVEAKLVELVKASENIKAFQIAATKIPEVVQNDVLMANVLDDGPEGFYTKNKSA